MSGTPESDARGRCNQCGRDSPIRIRDTYPPMPHLGIHEPWIFRFYLCRWHLAAENREAKKLGLRLIESSPTTKGTDGQA